MMRWQSLYKKAAQGLKMECRFDFFLLNGTPNDFYFRKLY